MPAGEVVAVKVLASNSKQGEKEFQTEVFKPRNLVKVVAVVTFFVALNICFSGFSSG